MGKSRSELVECATALLNVGVGTSVDSMNFWIAEGYRHLDGLRAAKHCNPVQIYALANRIERVEYLLEQKQKLEAERSEGAA
jgi:hypothetical protein